MKLSIIASSYAKELHRNVNHLYDGKPYEVHLKMCSEAGQKFIDLIPEHHVERVFAAIWCHDIIEDCRVTYNDVKKVLGEQVADIVYACTNEKGKTREDRANQKFYYELRKVPYAVFVKLCDRIANMEYSLSTRSRMAKRYAKEYPSFRKQFMHHVELTPMLFYLDHLAHESEALR